MGAAFLQKNTTFFGTDFFLQMNVKEGTAQKLSLEGFQLDENQWISFPVDVHPSVQASISLPFSPHFAVTERNEGTMLWGRNEIRRQRWRESWKAGGGKKNFRMRRERKEEPTSLSRAKRHHQPRSVDPTDMGWKEEWSQHNILPFLSLPPFPSRRGMTSKRKRKESQEGTSGKARRNISFSFLFLVFVLDHLQCWKCARALFISLGLLPSLSLTLSH